jgi:hypothetical protein
MWRLVRYSSSLPVLWVKHNGSQAIKVSTTGCKDISDLTKLIKKELSPKLNPYSSDQLTLHKSLNDAPLRPGLTIEELSKFVEPNTDESPLFVKTQESITTTQKTIFVQDIDAECVPLDSFTKVIVENNDDLKQIFEGKGSALYQLSNPKDRVTKMKQLIDGERYNVYSRYEQSFVDEVRWQQMEDQAMEQETYLAVKRFLVSQLGESVADMPTDILGSHGKTIVQEWDAVFRDGDVLYLCEAKHNITLEQVNKLPERIKKFKQFQADAQSEFHSAKKLVGVLCGTLFPEKIRKTAHLLQFICVYPSGHRYDVQKSTTEFIIER